MFAVEGVGDDPIRATGAILLDLPAAMKKLDTRKGQVLSMRPRQPPLHDPRELFQRLPDCQKTTYDELMAELAASRTDLRKPVLPAP